MTTTCNVSRNIEYSCIDHIRANLQSNMVLNVEKSFEKIYALPLPSLFLRIEDTYYDWAEIGSDLVVRKPTLYIDLFCQSEGQRLDYKDFFCLLMRNGFVYYEYVLGNNGMVSSKTANGRVRILEMRDNAISFLEEREKLDIHDLYRHQIVLTIGLGKVE